MRHVTAEHVAFAQRQSVLRCHGERLRNVEVGAASIERFVEAVKRSRETVTLAAGGGREIVIQGFAPGIVGRHPQRANLPLQADLQGVVLAPAVVVA